MKRDYLQIPDLTAEETLALLDRADALKAARRTAAHPRPLAGRSVALLFEKPSTRTRVSFEVGVYELGGHPVVMSSRDMQLGRGESIEDTARTLSRYVDAIVLRTFGHTRIEALAFEGTYAGHTRHATHGEAAHHIDGLTEFAAQGHVASIARHHHAHRVAGFHRLDRFR